MGREIVVAAAATAAALLPPCESSLCCTLQVSAAQAEVLALRAQVEDMQQRLAHGQAELSK
jgi:hypothetical protein